jgi:hypothetical protein
MGATNTRLRADQRARHSCRLRGLQRATEQSVPFFRRHATRHLTTICGRSTARQRRDVRPKPVPRIHNFGACGIADTGLRGAVAVHSFSMLMMRKLGSRIGSGRPFHARVGSGLLLLLLLLVQSGIEPSHACPVHDAAATRTEPTHAEHHAHHEDESSQNGTAHCCTCLGSCLSATAVAIPSAAIHATTPLLDRFAASYARIPAAPTAAQPRLLPFATAPPEP